MNLFDHQEYIYLPLLTVGEPARYLGVGRKIIYQLIEYELLKTVRSNGAVRIEKRILDELKSSGIIP